MENVNENVVNDGAKKNINSFKNYILKNSSTIAIVLSIISILFSTFTLVRVNRRPKRDFRMERPYDIQSEMPNDYFYNGNGGPNGNIGAPNDNQFYSQRPPMHNDNKFNSNRPQNNQYGYKRQHNNQDGIKNKNNYRFNKPNQNNNSNGSQRNNTPSTNPGTSNNVPKVAPEISPSK